MKKRVAVLFTVVMLLFTTSALATRWTEWELGYFVDEFGDSTDAWYVARSIPSTVYYANSTSWGRTTVAVSRDLAYIYLYENFDISDLISGNLVINDTPTDIYYDISVRTAVGATHKFTGIMRSQDDVIYLDDMHRFGELLRNNDDLRFVVSPMGNNIHKYTFSIDGVTNFKEVLPYDRWEAEYEREEAKLAEKYTVPNKWGYIDTKGDLVLSCQWDDAGFFSEGVANVRSGAKEAVIDTNGTTVVPYDWNYVGAYNDGVSIVQSADGTYGVVDKKGNLIASGQWSYAMPAFDGTITVFVSSDKPGVLDLEGNWLIPVGKLYNIGYFSEGLAYALQQKGGKYGFIDKQGNFVLPCKWEYTYGFSEGLCAVEDKKWGFINTTGELVIPCKWDSVGSFSNGLAYVKQGNKYGFIDTVGNLIIPCEWDKCGSFSEGYAWVKQGDKYGYIDKNGTLVIPCEWEDADNFYEGVASVKKDGKYGFIDTYGNVVIACEWSNATRFSYGLAAVQAP